MGYNLHVLAEEALDGEMNGRSACLELRENFHDHVGDQRPVYTKEEFLVMSDHWIAARMEYDRLGQPNPEEQNVTLDARVLPGEGLHKSRVAIELTGNANFHVRESVHFHYNNFRIHITEEDFYRTASVWEEAKISYNQKYSEVVKLSDSNVILSSPALNYYIPWLEEYEGGADPDKFWELFLESKRLIRPADEQRYSDGWLEPKTRPIPRDFDRQYLYTMYECMKKYGYAEGPFLYNYVHAERFEGRILIRGAHRGACLKVLGYDEVPVIITRKTQHE